MDVEKETDREQLKNMNSISHVFILAWFSQQKYINLLFVKK